jgi:hypothetical protein
MGQGRRVSPPEPFQRPRGPPHAGLSSSTNLSRADEIDGDEVQVLTEIDPWA